MPDDIDDTDEDLGRAFAAMLASSQAIPQMIQAMRALAGQFTQSRDKEAAPEEVNKTPGAPSEVPREPLALLVQANALFLAGAARYWKDWQEVVSDHFPRIADSLEDLSNVKGDDKTKKRNAVVDEVRRYLKAMARLPRDHGLSLERDLEKLADTFMSNDKPRKTRPYKIKD